MKLNLKFKFTKNKAIIIFSVLVVLLIVIILIFDKRNDKKSNVKASSEVTTAQTQTEQVESVVMKLADFDKYGLQIDAVPEITTLVSNYQKAKITGDEKLMLTVYGRTVEDEALKAKLEEDKRYYEKFSDTVCYETKGVVEDSYLVFISSKIKFRFVDTLASNFTWTYVQKQSDGSFIFKDPFNLTTEETAYVNKISASNEVKELAAKSRKELAEAVISGAELANRYKILSNSSVSDVKETNESVDETKESVSEAQISIIEESTKSETSTQGENLSSESETSQAESQSLETTESKTTKSESTESPTTSQVETTTASEETSASN